MELTPRLKKIADLVPHCTTVADIGTDHGYIPIYCVEKGICQNAVAMDVNEGPLAFAQKNISCHGLDGSIQTRLSDGMAELHRDEADCVVIAGMGGLLINRILSQGLDQMSLNQVFVIQPMIAVSEVREFLCSNNFEILEEHLESEDEKIYNIIKARFGYNRPLTQTQITVGVDIFKNSPDLYLRYLNWKINILKKIICGLNRSSNKDVQSIMRTQSELELYVREAKRYEG